jgi:hypothetical protein
MSVSGAFARDGYGNAATGHLEFARTEPSAYLADFVGGKHTGAPARLRGYVL